MQSITASRNNIYNKPIKSWGSKLMEKKEIDYKALGNRIRKWRKEKGITQEELASAIEKTVQHISNIERAHTKVSLGTLTDIGNFLDVSLNDLMCDSLRNSGNAYQLEYSLMIKDCDENQYRRLNKTIKALMDTWD